MLLPEYMAKVLVVDDDSHFRVILERIILRSYTYSVKTVSTEEEAWEELSNSSYDLVLLDLYLDGKKSWDTLRRIRDLAPPPAVVMISCESTKENAEYARSLGAHDFVPKPIDFARFKTTVDDAIGSRRKGQPARRIGDGAAGAGGIEEMRILIVAEEKTDRRAIADPLEKAGFRTLETDDTMEAAEVVQREPMDAVLVGFQGEGERAAERLKAIREGAAGTRRFPVIAVTDASSETILASLKSGADDYISFPFDPVILAGKVEAHVRLRREYDLRLEEVVALCVKDALTGSYNHAYFKARLNEEFHRSQRYKRNLALAILGLDNLEKTNAAFGPMAGNRILSEAGRVIRNAMRSTDVVARSGEAEFALILPEATSERILSKADLVRSKVQDRVSLLDDRRTNVTCSVGLASMEVFPYGVTDPDQVQSAEDLLGMANMALTRARGSGSGRVEIFGR